MTSRELAVFAYLPGEPTAVPAGLFTLEEEGTTQKGAAFVYGLRYLDRPNAIEIDPVSLGLRNKDAVRGVVFHPVPGLTLFGAIRDAAPDAWGRRVIEARRKVPLGHWVHWFTADEAQGSASAAGGTMPGAAGTLGSASAAGGTSPVMGEGRTMQEQLSRTPGAAGAPSAVNDAASQTTLLYQPLGSVAPAANFLVSDSDFVEVLTEIDIQTPMPDAVRKLRVDRHFLFLGCRFATQIDRIFARQIMKHSSTRHWAVIPGELTRNEQRFLAGQGIERLDMPLEDFVARLTAGAPGVAAA
jgi:hypothetical protein